MKSGKGGPKGRLAKQIAGNLALYVTNEATLRKYFTGY